MANIYWIKGGADAHWDTHTGNWFDDVTGLVQASDGPQDGDYAYLTGATAPDSGPAVPVSLIGLDTSGLAAAVTFSGTVYLSGSLVLGAPGGTDVHTFEGNGLLATSALIQGASVVAGPISAPDVIFKDTSVSSTASNITGNARFYDSSGAKGGEFSGRVYCYGSHTFCEDTAALVITGSNIYVFGSLTINNTGANGITGTPNIYLMSRTANFRPIGSVTANVVPYRFATAHRLRRIS